MRHRSVMWALVGLTACTTGGGDFLPAFDSGALDAGTDGGRIAAPLDAGPRPDAGPPLADVTIYAHSREVLYAFSAYTNLVQEVGAFTIEGGAPAPTMLDLAVDSSGTIFTSSEESLWQVDPETARLTKIGDFRIGDEQLFALSFLDPAESPDGTEMLVGATNEGTYYRIDRTNARARVLGEYPDGWFSSGDIVSVEGLGNFATLRRDGARPGASDVLARIDFLSDGSSTVDVIGPIGFSQIFGLGYWGRNLYGFTNDGKLIQIDRRTGEGTEITADTGTDSFWGAGVTTKAYVLI